MYSVSQAFKDSLLKSHKIKAFVEFYDSGVLVKTVDVLGGNVSVDSAGSIRRRANLRIADTDGSLTPSAPSDLLAPYGNEFKPYRGIVFDDGTSEVVPLGVFNINKIEIEDTGPEYRLNLSGFDRSRKVARARFTDVYVVNAGTNYATAIQNIISSRIAGLTYNFMNTTFTTPLLVFEGGGDQDDPWKVAQEMAASIGAELFFDANGVCVLRPVPDPLVDPVVFTYEEGINSTILYVNKSLEDEVTYNHIVVTGESTSNTEAVRAEAKDLNTNSPTYINGDYGDVPYFISSKFITTQAQAQATADAKLLETLGSTEHSRFISVVNPAHEGGDVIQLTTDRSKINDKFVLETFNVPLEHSYALNADLKKRRV